MIAVVERVKNASLTADGVFTSKIDKGLLVFVGVYETDTEKEADILAAKIANLRIFEDENEKMNLSVKDEIPRFWRFLILPFVQTPKRVTAHLL